MSQNILGTYLNSRISHTSASCIVNTLAVQYVTAACSMYSFPHIASIGGEVGQDMVQLEELKLAANNLSSAEAYLNKFITSLPV